MSDDLDRLEAEAAAVDGQATAAIDPSPQDAPEAAAPDVPAEVAALLQTVSGLFSPLFPCLASIYTPDTCRRLGDAAAPVMEKYGWSVGGLFERWGAEITLAATAFPVAMATWQGVKADLATKRAPKAEPEAVKKPEASGFYAAERADSVPVPPPALVIGAP